uniref:WD repeat and SOCS box containing 2 n=1 Tax=Hippocampus comes TaxID=109280 RepID=A0A3Q2X8U7_HIPCM
HQRVLPLHRRLVPVPESHVELPSSDPALILELKTRRPPSLEGRPGCETWSVDFSPDGAWFAWSMGHGIVWVVAWPLDAQYVTTSFHLGCGHPVWGLAFGPRNKNYDGNALLLATGLENGTIKIWNVFTGVATLELHGHEGVVRNLLFLPNGTLTLVSSSRDKTLRVWDLALKGKKVQVLSGHKDWISCCCVSSDCSMIATVGRFDRMVCLWSLRSYTFIRNLTGGAHKTLYLLSACDFSPDGALLATAAFSGGSWWIDLWDPYTAQKLATLTNEVSVLCVCVCVFVCVCARNDFRTRNGHVRFWRAPRVVPDLRHLWRAALDVDAGYFKKNILISEHFNTAIGALRFKILPTVMIGMCL